MVSALGSRASFLSIAFFVLLAFSGCAPRGVAVKAAEQGNWALLKRALADDKRTVRLREGEAHDVAYAVASHELRAAQGTEGPTRVDELRLCASKVESALKARANTRDEGAARAAYVLADEHLQNRSSWRNEVTSQDPAWRAVGARTLTEPRDGPLRRALLVDLNTPVRHAALHASIEASEWADTPLLLEVMRLDPDGLARNLAAQALGSLGGYDVVLRLRDRWASADEPLRAAIAAAWGSPASYSAGGRDELRWAAESEHGTPAIAAGSVLFHMGGSERASGEAALARAIENGPTNERIVAIRLSEWRNGTEQQAILKASQDEDIAVRITALEKMGSSEPALRGKALAELGPIAAGSSTHAPAARAALALLHDRRVVGLLENDLFSSDPEVRVRAAGELAMMREFSVASQALADSNSSVRTRVACTILNTRSQQTFLSCFAACLGAILIASSISLEAS